MMTEMSYYEWASWSDETDDPQVFRPRPSEWELIGYLTNNGYWGEIQGVVGEKPRLLEGINLLPPTEYELSYYGGAADVTLYDANVDANAYESRSPRDSQFSAIGSIESAYSDERDEAA